MGAFVGRSILFWPCLVLAPGVLGAMELFHPANFTHAPGMYAYLCTSQPYDPAFRALGYFGPWWWVTMHAIQLPLLGLVAIGLWSLVGDISGGLAGAAAALSRVATFVFAICYTALDSIGGIGLGRSILNLEHLQQTGQLTAQEAAGAKKLLDTDWLDPVTGGMGSVISLGGSWAVLVAAVTAALALGAARRAPWPPLLMLVAFGWELQLTHAAPHGPIAFALLLCAALWLRLGVTIHWPARADAALATAVASR